ncbi:Gfo/Idh/MocA family protein [Sinomonas sp. G460-2]|uniref:Gfo/Idh/MocA family protein n=1 Tax=Sinomonas sp. G460-2 TaxID=3393464 RepID=UPI0039F017EF
MTEVCSPYAALRGGPTLRWGIAAPGFIARDFTSTVLRNTNQEVVAVGSRSSDRAESFAREFGIPSHFGEYDALFESDADVIYVASVNSQHADLALRAIAAGKHVLIEKPLGTNPSQVRAVRDAARDAGVLAMEAMWPRYLPTYVELQRQLDLGLIGDVRLAGVDVGWRSEPNDGTQIWDADGGVILDRGVYGYWFACFAVGWPTQMAVIGTELGGVDAQVVTALRSSEGRMASVSLTLEGLTSGHAEITGDRGSFEIQGHAVFAEGFNLVTGERRREWRDPAQLRGREGLAWQAAAFARFVDEGLLDSPLHSLGSSLRLAQIMSAARDLVKAGGGISPIDFDAA